MNKTFLRTSLYALIGLVLLFSIAFIGSVIKISNSKAYTFAKQYINTNEKVISRIGDVEKFGMFPTGSLDLGKNEVGENEVQIETKVFGKLGKANIVLVLTKVSSTWKVNEFYFKELK
ncbi:hypothetical protein [Mangrovimonas cancribranchiae]|uniref:DUF4878 domain-containing protein n=1 Tax=Mangrovimonas cancribranchiae TaxID=3080055 RepID=A0AAU6P6L3_9FLAO